MFHLIPGWSGNEGFSFLSAKNRLQTGYALSVEADPEDVSYHQHYTDQQMRAQNLLREIRLRLSRIVYGVTH